MHHVNRSPYILAAAILYAVSTGAQAQQQTPAAGESPPEALKPNAAGTPSTQAAAPSESDKQFVIKAAHAGLAEVQLAQLALKKSTSADVKGFAQQMITDHSKANDTLKTLASGKGIPLPTQPDDRHLATYKRLEALTGRAFDAAYIQSQKDDHREAVALFRKQSQQGGDPALKQFASITLPTLENHRQHVEQLKPDTSGPAGTSGPAPTPQS